MNLIQELYTLKSPCIYGFVNKRDHKIFIGFSTNIIETLKRTISDVRLGLHVTSVDFSSVEFIIIETVDFKNMRFRYQYWVEHYRNNGWTLYRNYQAMKYKLKVEAKFFDHVMYVHVYLKTSGRKIITLGLFKEYGEASSFIETFYRTAPYDRIVVASNEHTSRYLNG